MDEAALFRYRTHTDGTVWYNTITVGGRRIYEGPSHLDLRSAEGEMADLKDDITNLRCNFCGEVAGLVYEVAGPGDVQGFCGRACYLDSMRESERVK
jgi:hypothetical protein